MKILHTADWHVGKTLGGRGRAAEHEAVLDEIAELARREHVDVVLVAGDVFDSVSPGPESERIVYDALLALGRQAPVVVIAGNHDHERRLAAVAPVFSLANVIVGRLAAEPLEIETRDGERARVALLPWLSQRYVIKADNLMVKDADELSGQFAERMGRIVAAVTEGFADDAVNVVLGHVTILGGRPGGGERTAQTISDYWVSPTVFPAGAHYVALGHLHRMQRMPGACPIYYAGSPLQLDFSDVDDSKHVLIVEASPRRPAVVEPIELRSGRRLRTVSGNLEQLAAIAPTMGDDYLRIRLQEAARTGLGDDVRALFPDTVVKVIVEADDHPGAPARAEIGSASSPRDLFARYLAGKGVVDERLVAMFDRLYEGLHETAAS